MSHREDKYFSVSVAWRAHTFNYLALCHIYLKSRLVILGT